MHQIKNFIMLILGILLIISCEQIVPFPATQDSPLMALNGIFTDDEALSIHLSSTLPINTQEVEHIFDATAELITPDGHNHLLSHSVNGNYFLSNVVLEENKTYEIKASHPEFPDIESSTQLPEKFTAKLIDTSLTNIEGVPGWSYDIMLEAKESPDKYFMIDVSYTYLDSTILPMFIDDPKRIEFSHFSTAISAENQQILADISDPAEGLKAIFIPKPYLAEEKFNISFIVADRNLSKATKGQTNAQIRVRSIGKELYQYYKTLERYRLSLGDFFIEPVQIHSNIHEGVGIFGAYQEQIIQIQL